MLPIGALLLFVLAVHAAWASPSERIGILQVTNVSGARQGDLERRAGQALATALGEEGITAVPKKEIKLRLSKLKLQKVEDYLPLLSAGEVAKLCRKVDVDRLVTLNVRGYNEFVRNGKRTIEIRLELETFLPERQESQVYYGEATGEQGLEFVVNTAVRKVLDNMFGKTPLEEPDARSIHAYQAPVVVNRESGQYHLPTAHHLPKAVRRMEYPTRRQAENDGYSPCPICFPGYEGYFDSDRELESELGARAAGIIENYYRIVNNPEQLGRIQRVADRLMPVTGRKNIQYHFNLLGTDEVNAFSLPGGLIYVTTGLLGIIENDDELAFVLAHEMVHNVRKHAIAQYRLAIGMQFLSLLLVLGDDGHRERDYFLANLLNGIIQSGYSREQENEADRLGLVYAMQSGYDPEAYQSIFGKFIDMKSHDSYLIERMFASHPGPEQRMQQLNEFLDGLKKIKMQLAN